MILSAQQILSDDQAITATAISTNVIDLGVPGTPYAAAAALNFDVGKGTPICFLAQVTEAFNTLTTLTFTLETSANSDLSASTVLATEEVALADLIPGKQMFMQVLPSGITERYLGTRYTVAGTPPTLGRVTVGPTLGNQTNVTGA